MFRRGEGRDGQVESHRTIRQHGPPIWIYYRVDRARQAHWRLARAEMIENGCFARARHADSVRELEDSVATLNTEQLRRLARLGAIARLEQLKQEEAAI